MFLLAVGLVIFTFYYLWWAMGQYDIIDNTELLLARQKKTIDPSIYTPDYLPPRWTIDILKPIRFWTYYYYIKI